MALGLIGKDVAAIQARIKRMDVVRKEVIHRIKLLEQLPNLPQRQDSFMTQMRDLYAVANHLGLCDAADGIMAAWLGSGDKEDQCKD